MAQEPPDKWSDMEDKLRILQDMNMMYIRQIALSLQDTDIQKRIDHEVRIRDGAMKLLGACTQKEQALEAAKSLLVCNNRIMTYMSELQHRKEEQVLQHSARRPSDGGSVDERLPCKGKLSISDLRIPLMWKDSEYFKNKGGESIASRIGHAPNTQSQLSIHFSLRSCCSYRGSGVWWCRYMRSGV
ncbi:rhotekin-like [Mantella aurantiaca]